MNTIEYKKRSITLKFTINAIKVKTTNLIEDPSFFHLFQNIEKLQNKIKQRYFNQCKNKLALWTCVFFLSWLCRTFYTQVMKILGKVKVIATEVIIRGFLLVDTVSRIIALRTKGTLIDFRSLITFQNLAITWRETNGKRISQEVKFKWFVIQVKSPSHDVFEI